MSDSQRPLVLVVVDGGVAETYVKGDVDVQVIDRDNIRCGDTMTLPANIGFEALVHQADLDDLTTTDPNASNEEFPILFE